MKNYLIIFTSFILISSCKKTNDTPQPSAKLYAAVTLTKYCYNLLLPDSAQYIDSPIVFVNHSYIIGAVTNQTASYKWDFGDNTISTVVSPVHAYAKNATYQVTLITFLNGVPSDTLYRNVRILIGQKEFKTSMNYTQSVDLDETVAKGALILVSAFNSFSDPYSYSLIKVDSFLKAKWVKPVLGSNIRLSSLKKINASSYILSGNFSPGNPDVFSISKIDSAGNLQWVKFVADIHGRNTYTTPTSDGGFLTIGDSTFVGNYCCIAIKFDANGNEQWRRLFNGTQVLKDPDNIIEIGGGYIFASIVRGFSNHQLVLTKLDLNGNTIQQGSTFTGNSNSIFNAGIVHLNNTYLVYATNAADIYLFNDNLTFINSRSLGQYGINSVSAQNGFFYSTESNNQYSFVKQIAVNGNINWSSLIFNSVPISCNGFWSGATRYCKKVIFSGNDAVIALSYGENDQYNNNTSSVYVEKFQLDGKLK